jgi:high-affinity Fe2+/Pb2+ permease
MYWLSAAAALALVLLVLMYVLRRYRGSKPYKPSGRIDLHDGAILNTDEYDRIIASVSDRGK